jgi:hypothetical protein
MGSCLSAFGAQIALADARLGGITFSAQRSTVGGAIIPLEEAVEDVVGLHDVADVPFLRRGQQHDDPTWMRRTRLDTCMYSAVSEGSPAKNMLLKGRRRCRG